MASSPSDDIFNFHLYLSLIDSYLQPASATQREASVHTLHMMTHNCLAMQSFHYRLQQWYICLFVIFYLRILNHINFRMLPWLGSRLMARPLRSRFESPGIPQKKKACWRKTSKLKTRIRENKFFEHMLSVRPLHGLAPRINFCSSKSIFFSKIK